MKNLIITIFAIAIFAGCTKTVLIDVPYPGDKLVLTSLITQDSFVYARLSKSSPPGVYVPPNFLVPGGAINLFENNVPLGAMQIINVNGLNWYKSNAKAKANAVYSFSGTATNLGTVTGFDAMPTKPSWRTLSYTNISPNPNSLGNDENAKINVELKDNSAEANYYVIKVLQVDTNVSPIGPRLKIFNASSGYYFTAPELTTGSTLLDDEERYNEFYFTDETFNGRTINLSIRLNHYDKNTKPHLAPVITSVSKAYYLYITSLENANNNNGNPFSEATTVFNNITNGYGIIGCQADSTLFIRKP